MEEDIDASFTVYSRRGDIRELLVLMGLADKCILMCLMVNLTIFAASSAKFFSYTRGFTQAI